MALSKALFSSLTKAAVKHIVNLMTFGMAGEIVVDAWETYSRSVREEAQRRAEVEALACASDVEIAELTEEIVAEEGVALPVEQQEKVKTMLRLTPDAIRRSQRRADDPSGKSLSAHQRLASAQDLQRIVPGQMPRFKKGDYPLAGVDLMLEELLGVGGFGEVWKARDPDRPTTAAVALKFCIDAAARQKLLTHEAKILMQVEQQGTHPGIVRLEQKFLRADPPALAFEYVDGGDLAGLMREWHALGLATPDRIAELMLQLCEIVAFAHSLTPGVIHRDLKPSNILVQGTREKPRLRVADFGIGGLAGTIRGTTQSLSVGAAQMATALAGAYSPLYASPQQVMGGKPDARDDVYSLGVIWYQMLMGSVILPAPTGAAWIQKLHAKGAVEKLVNLLQRCVEQEREDRPRDAHELVEVLQGERKVRESEQERKQAALLAANLQRWKEAKQADVWIARRLGRSWYLSEWREYLGQLQGGAYWPMEEAEIEREMEAAKKRWDEAARQEQQAEKRLTEAKVQAPQTPVVKSKEENRIGFFGWFVGVFGSRKGAVGEIITNSIGMKFARIVVEPVEFWMGADRKVDHEASDDESPRHKVRLTRPFALGIYPVTQGQYERVMGKNPSYFSATGYGSYKVTGMDTTNFPVESVSWDDAQEYVKTLNNLPAEKDAGRRYRLPSEAEWEYACRGVSMSESKYRKFYFGNQLSHSKANLNEDLDRTSKVGTYRTNGFGLYDMHGNVCEWCEDWKGAYPDKADTDPTGPSKGWGRVFRGGCWVDDARHCRSAYRGSHYDPGYYTTGLGFRLALVSS